MVNESTRPQSQPTDAMMPVVFCAATVVLCIGLPAEEVRQREGGQTEEILRRVRIV